jgi:UDP-N-acetylmuramoylalanine--D-glutamate ligase
VSRALVIGLARSGSAAALALRRSGISVVGVDGDGTREVGRLREAGVEVRLGGGIEPGVVDGVEVVIKSPGVPSSEPLVARARAANVPVWSEVELGARLLPQPVIGVTGTNGKTTTVELLGAMLRADGRRVAVAGNVGHPLTAVAPDDHPEAAVVCELSSFQLEDIVQFRARAAVLLNVTPDHLDRHASLEAYTASKLRIFENQQADDVAIVPAGFGPVPGAGQRVEFSVDEPLRAEPLLPGPHNRANAVAAAHAARARGVLESSIAEGLGRFRGLAHRLETIRAVRGVEYVNDSKATNPEAAEQALLAYPGARVILGGSLKGSSFDALARRASETAVSRAYLIGEAARRIADALAAEGVDHVELGDLASALEQASADACEGEVVLLAPACASFDQFNDFEHRGARFRALVEEL